MTLIKTMLLPLLLLPALIFGNTQQEKEIKDLKVKVASLASNFQTTINKGELKNNHNLAVAQANLLRKVFTYEIHMKLKKMGFNRSKKDIEEMVEAAWNNAWIFQDLGATHADRFLLILQWAKDESGFGKNTVASWKKGQYIKRMDITITKDSTDYGAWQNNGDNLQFLKIVNYLYESGVIRFKVKKIRTVSDLMDIQTSATARCLIETDRKSRGWEWRHIGDKKFYAWLYRTLGSLEREGSYNQAFVEKYYNVTPYKKLSYAHRNKKK